MPGTAGVPPGPASEAQKFPQASGRVRALAYSRKCGPPPRSHLRDDDRAEGTDVEQQLEWQDVAELTQEYRPDIQFAEARLAVGDAEGRVDQEVEVDASSLNGLGDRSCGHDQRSNS